MEHRLKAAMEAAGLELCDTVLWVFATGPVSARTRLKPAWQPVVLARRPGPTRELNIDGSRTAGVVLPRDRRTSPRGRETWSASRSRCSGPCTSIRGRSRSVSRCPIGERWLGSVRRSGTCPSKALMCDAAGVVLFHHHPSGHPVPSDGDMRWTESFAAHAAALGLSVLDHLVLGERPKVGSLRRLVAGLGWESAAWWGHDKLGERLQEVHERAERAGGNQRRRPAAPKYKDPETGQTWAGRGSMARWLRTYVQAGRDPEEFRVGGRAARVVS